MVIANVRSPTTKFRTSNSRVVTFRHRYISIWRWMREHRPTL